MDSLILTTIIATLCIMGLNVFLFREKIVDIFDVHGLWASGFFWSVCGTFLIIILIYLYGFFVEAFSNPTVNALIFFGTFGGMLAALLGMGLKKQWFIFFWLGVVLSSLIITIQEIDPYTIPFPIWSLVIMGLMWINLHYYNNEKKEFFYLN
jgi:hypothetical protein